jgi:hypothetical protein
MSTSAERKKKREAAADAEQAYILANAERQRQAEAAWPDGTPDKWNDGEWYRHCDHKTGRVEEWRASFGERDVSLGMQREIQASITETAPFFRWSVWFSVDGSDLDIGYVRTLQLAMTRAESAAQSCLDDEETR